MSRKKQRRWTEDEIKSQSRYNPEYDVKGFYYRWIEPRFKPELFDDMTRDYTNTHPAKRFASVADDVSKVISVMQKIKNKMERSDIKGTRVLCSTDVLPALEKIIEPSANLNCIVKYLGILDGEEICSVWIVKEGIGLNS